MKFTPYTAAAILAFIAYPTQAVPLTPVTMNQTNVTIPGLGPMRFTVSPEGIMIPGSINGEPTETTSTGLPFDGPVSNVRPDHSPTRRPAHDIGEVRHGGGGLEFVTITTAPNPTATFSISNRTGGPITVPFHRVLQNIGPRDGSSSAPSNVTSFDEALGRYVRCMNEPVEFDKVLAHLHAIEKSYAHHISQYEASNTHDNVTNAIFKGLRFTVGEEFGTRILHLQEAQITRQWLCQAKKERGHHSGILSTRDANSTEFDAAEQEWMALEARTIRIADEVSEIEPTASEPHNHVVNLVHKLCLTNAASSTTNDNNTAKASPKSSGSPS